MSESQSFLLEKTI